MVTGVTGSNGLAAPRHVDLAEEAGQETVTTQLQLMEAKTVQDQARSQEFVTPMLVQVKPFMILQWMSKYFIKLMENGETGRNGQYAQKHVDLGKGAG